jgi:hypothetical protein
VQLLGHAAQCVDGGRVPRCGEPGGHCCPQRRDAVGRLGAGVLAACCQVVSLIGVALSPAEILLRGRLAARRADLRPSPHGVRHRHAHRALAAAAAALIAAVIALTLLARRPKPTPASERQDPPVVAPTPTSLPSAEIA